MFGSTDEQLAEFLQVSIDTIYEWKKVYPDFSEAIKSGKAEFDDNLVEASLLKRAMGYTRQVERMGKHGPEMCTEELPPDPTSMIFWLKNRQPKKWRDKQEHELSGKDGAPITPIINVTVGALGGNKPNE